VQNMQLMQYAVHCVLPPVEANVCCTVFFAEHVQTDDVHSMAGATDAADNNGY
jgi:hypothetical protein